MLNILVIAICAVICGADEWSDVEAFVKAKRQWLKPFLHLPRGRIPSHGTFRRVLAQLDPAAFEKCFLEWIRAVSALTADQVVAINALRYQQGNTMLDTPNGLRWPQVGRTWIVRESSIIPKPETRL